MRGGFKRAFLLALGLAFGLGGATQAQDKPHIRMSSLTLPVLNPIIVNILKAKNFDEKNGFVMDVTQLPSITALYAAFATGEVDTIIGGPTVIQKLRNEGAPVKIVGTGLKLSDLVIFSDNPAIKTFADLKGKQLAADMGSQQYQIVAMYGLSKNLKMREDVTLVDANFALARSQLAAKRVDAAMVIEPIASLMLKENPNLNIVFGGASAWKEMTGRDGWELVTGLREEAIKRWPKAPQALIASLQDVENFIKADPDGADKIAAETVKLPPGTLKAAVTANRWQFEVKPAWGDERQAIWDMFDRAVKSGFQQKLPDEAIIYTP